MSSSYVSSRFRLTTNLKSQHEQSSIIKSNEVTLIFNELNSRFLFGLVNYLKNDLNFRRNCLSFFTDKSKCIELFTTSQIAVKYLSQSIKPSKFHIIVLDINFQDVIIRTWSSIVLYWANKKIFYDAAWAYLSTLGGAYSSLGDEKDKFAKDAEILSLKQLKLTYDFNDPIASVRCKIYFVSSQTQLKKFRSAKFILNAELENVRKYRKYDDRIGNMYIAAWKKLIYSIKIHRSKN